MQLIATPWISWRFYCWLIAGVLNKLNACSWLVCCFYFWLYVGGNTISNNSSTLIWCCWYKVLCVFHVQVVFVFAVVFGNRSRVDGKLHFIIMLVTLNACMACDRAACVSVLFARNEISLYTFACGRHGWFQAIIQNRLKCSAGSVTQFLCSIGFKLHIQTVSQSW